MAMKILNLYARHLFGRRNARVQIGLNLSDQDYQLKFLLLTNSKG